jgi:coenzyme F420-0:L-glutamate ligase/coenzyme F420-1:gamma-L-glutamate ligase
MPARQLTLIGVDTLPRVQPGDDLARQLTAALTAAGITLQGGDIVVVCQKVVSKAEGRVATLAEVEPSPFARQIAAGTDKDPRVVELVLQETTRIVRMADGHLICETGPGWVCANAGIDESNGVAPGTATLLPRDPDASAERLREVLSTAAGVRVGVIVTDTFGRAWRDGLVDVAIGAAGIGTLHDLRGRHDLDGRELHHTVLAIGDQIAAAAGILMAKDGGVAAVVVRGVDWTQTHGRGRDLIRPRQLDLFR